MNSPRTILHTIKKAAIIIAVTLSLSAIAACCAKEHETGTHEYHEPTAINDSTAYTAALSKLEQEYDNIHLFQQAWSYATQNSDISGIVRCAENILAGHSGSPVPEIYACTYAAQSYLYTEQYDKCKPYLIRGMRSLKENADSEMYVASMLYNLSAIYAMKKDYNYLEAIEYLGEAVKAAKSINDSQRTCTYLCNISNIYALREDPTGIEYAKEAYDISSRLQDINIKSIAALSLSMMSFLNSDTTEALKYAREATEYTSDPDYFINNKADIFLNRAEINKACGNTDEAALYYSQSLAYLRYAAESIAIRVYYSYGDFKLELGENDEAIKYFLYAKSLYESNGNIEYQYQILMGLSKAFGNLGEQRISHKYLEESYNAFRQIMTFQKEQDFSNMKLKYEEAKYNEELNKKELEILRKNYNFYIILFISSIITILLVYSYILYRKKNIMYRNIVQQNYNYRKELEGYKNLEKIKQDEKNKRDEISRSKMELFEKIERLMNEEKIYRKKELTVENLAETVGTNMTYVSNVINQLAGKSFPAYLNSYRLKEVLENLSDNSSNENINSIFEKAGFSSRATYTRIFQKEIGCTPSQYREQMKKIGQNDI